MQPTDTNDLLNRLLVLNHRSLAQYLRYANPWRRYNDDRVEKVVLQIADNQMRMVDRLGKAILENRGTVHYGEFPMTFTGWHDLSYDFLLNMLVERQVKEVVAIERIVDKLRLSPMAQALAQESLGEAKAHLDMLHEAQSASPTA